MHINDLKPGDKVRVIKDLVSYAHKNDVFQVAYIGYNIAKMVATNKSIYVNEEMLDKYFEKVEQDEKVKIPVTSNDKSKMTRFEKDVLNDNVRHDNIKYETKDENKLVEEQHDDIPVITEDDVATLIEQSEIVTDRIYSDYMVVTCRLPNGYALSETFDLDGMDEDTGIEWCVNKIADRVFELESYRLKANAYDDGWFENEDEDMSCEDCSVRFDCVDSPYYNNY